MSLATAGTGPDPCPPSQLGAETWELGLPPSVTPTPHQAPGPSLLRALLRAQHRSKMNQRLLELKKKDKL